MRLSDLAGMDIIPDANDLDREFENFDTTLKRLAKAHELYDTMVRALPCTAKREKFVIMKLFASLISTAAAMLNKTAADYAEAEAVTDHKADIPW